MNQFRIAVLASTRGTDLQAIIDAIRAGTLHVELACVVSNVADCYALERAREQGFAAYFVDPKSQNGSKKTREEFDREMTEILLREKIDLIVLVGYMRILTPAFIEKFRGKIINVHPSLLPKFGGKAFYGMSVHEAVLAAGETETGMTIHYVTEEVDEGPIIVQKKVKVELGDTADSLREKVQAIEKEWYPKVIEAIAKEEKILNL